MTLMNSFIRIALGATALIALVSQTQAQPLPPYVWGLTTDACDGRTGAQVTSLKYLPKRTMLRTVFDMPADGASAAGYVDCVQRLSAVADIMGQPLDSSYMAGISLADTRTRMDQYLSTLGPYINVWEVGNEVNGNWLGNNVVPKIEAMYDKAKAASKLTAITFYYEPPSGSQWDMIAWIDKNIPAGHRIRAGLNYALVSYYEDQNGGHQLTQAELDTMFMALTTRFPNALVGIGEFGWGGRIPSNSAAHKALLDRFYSYRVPSVTAFIGGGFFWHFHQTMLGVDSIDLNEMKSLMSAQ